MRVLAGGPARETESALFRLHVEGLEAQSIPPRAPMLSRDTTDEDIRVMAGVVNGVDVTVRHELVPDDDGPRWHRDKIERVAKVRQDFLHDAEVYTSMMECRCDDGPTHNCPLHGSGEASPRALLLVDTDVILGPGVLERMWAVDADVVYGVFWTEADWGQPGPIAPQVWTHHPYVTNDGTWAALNLPGMRSVEVLGGGACTLIRGRGFESRYWPLLESLRRAEHQFEAQNPWQGGMWGGEDRTFCLGLETRGIRQVAVTGLPIFHVYDEWMQDPDYLENVVRVEVGL